MNKHTFSLENLRQDEQSAQNIFKKELSDCLVLGDNYVELLIDATSRYSDLCSEAKERPTEEEFFVQISVAALASNVINQLEAFQLCLKNGLLQPGISLSRTAFETTLLANYLRVKPEQAQKWVNGKKIEMADVRKILPEKENSSLVYKELSEISHPNFSSINHLLIIDNEKHEIKVLLGNTIDFSRILVATNMYFYTCRHAASTFIADIFNFEPKSDERVEFFERLGFNDNLFEELSTQIISHLKAS